MATDKLTDVACRRAKVGKHGDGGGLFLLVSPEGARYWRLKYAIGGRERLAGFGVYPDVTLAEARIRRDDFRKELRDGRDPIAEKRAARITTDTKERHTLRGFATRFHKSISTEFRNEKHAAQWLASLTPILDKLGGRRLTEIDENDLIDALEPIVRATPETGRRVRQRLRAVFDEALQRRLVERNPAALLHKVRTIAPKRGKEQHFAALPFDDVPEFLKRLRAFDGASISARDALAFAVLCAARTGEVLHATWTEIDERKMVWTIPGERTKQEEPHTVALSEPALAILNEMGQITDRKGYVFPSPLDPRKPLSGMAMAMMLRRLDDDTEKPYSDRTTVHGMCRSSFSTWAYERGFRSEVIEAALGHRERDKVKRAYSRATFDEERRTLFDQWGAFVTQAPRAKVLKLRRPA